MLQGLLQLFAENGVCIPLHKCGPCQYRLGTAKVAVRLVNGRLVARAGVPGLRMSLQHAFPLLHLLIRMQVGGCRCITLPHCYGCISSRPSPLLLLLLLLPLMLLFLVLLQGLGRSWMSLLGWRSSRCRRRSSRSSSSTSDPHHRSRCCICCISEARQITCMAPTCLLSRCYVG